MEISARRASGEETHGTIRARAFVLPGGFRLLVGRDPRGRADFEGLILETLGAALGITLVLGLLGGLVMSRRMLRRVDAVRETGQRIVRGDLSRRMPVTGVGDEFDRLSITVNEMLDEIETLMTGLRTVTDSVAHDLRSPLTRLKSRLELALREGPAGEHGHRAALERAIAETDGILRTFATLMEIARAESGHAGIALAPVDLRAIVADMVELYAPLAEEKGLAIEATLEETDAVSGHGQFLSQLVANLLDNALAYTPEGRIGVSLARDDAGAVRLTVEDSGPGIPPEERERVLQRFVRLDASRSGGGRGPRAQPRRGRRHPAPGNAGPGREPAGRPSRERDLPAAGRLSARERLPAERLDALPVHMVVENANARLRAHVDHAFRQAEAEFEIVAEAEQRAADSVQVFVGLVDHPRPLHGGHQGLQPGEDDLRVALNGEGLDAVNGCGAFFAAYAVVPAPAGLEPVAHCCRAALYCRRHEPNHDSRIMTKS